MRIKKVLIVFTLLMLGVSITPVNANNDIYINTNKGDNLVEITDPNPIMASNTIGDWKWINVSAGSFGTFEIKAKFYIDSYDNWRVYKVSVEGGYFGCIIDNVTSSPRVGGRMSSPICKVSARVTFNGKSTTVSANIDRRW